MNKFQYYIKEIENMVGIDSGHIGPDNSPSEMGDKFPHNTTVVPQYTVRQKFKFKRKRKK